MKPSERKYLAGGLASYAIAVGANAAVPAGRPILIALLCVATVAAAGTLAMLAWLFFLLARDAQADIEIACHDDAHGRPGDHPWWADSIHHDPTPDTFSTLSPATDAVGQAE